MPESDWNENIKTLPGAHILQTREWGLIKEAYGWKILPQEWRDENGRLQAAAQVLQRSISLGGLRTPFSVLYVSRGPMLDWADQALRRRVLDDLQTLARRLGAIFIKIDPEVIIGTGIPGTPEAQDNRTGQDVIGDLEQRGWKFSGEQIQFQNTVWLDLQPSEEDWLARMKQKTRYNLRLSSKKGVTVRSGTLDDLPLLYKMYAETSVRDGFVIRSEAYYARVWESFMRGGMAEPLIAEAEGEAIAAIFLFYFAGKSWYLYGMSREAQREKMPNYLLQWEGMRHSKAHGCRIYDLWGAPTVFDESDSMWGVFRFKEGLGGTVVRTLGAWDYPANGLLYALYTRILPRILDWMRNRGRQRTRQDVSL